MKTPGLQNYWNIFRWEIAFVTFLESQYIFLFLIKLNQGSGRPWHLHQGSRRTQNLSHWRNMFDIHILKTSKWGGIFNVYWQTVTSFYILHFILQIVNSKGCFCLNPLKKLLQSYPNKLFWIVVLSYWSKWLSQKITMKNRLHWFFKLKF